MMSSITVYVTTYTKVIIPDLSPFVIFMGRIILPTYSIRARSRRSTFIILGRFYVGGKVVIVASSVT